MKVIKKKKSLFFKAKFYLAIIIFIQVIVIVSLILSLYKNAHPLVTSSPNKYSETETLVHPYLGFVSNKDNDIYVNNFGFIGEAINRKDDEVKVGIFGGSVGLLYYIYEKDNLIRSLQQLDKFKGKKIKIYSFALGGYKQPQQLFTLTYLLSLGYHLDAIINIDGFNEVALAYAENYKGGISSYYPRTWNLYSRQYFNKDTYNLINTIEDLKTKENYFSNFPLIVKYVPIKIIDHLLRKKQSDLQKLLQISDKSFNIKGPEPFLQLTEKEIEQNIIDVWQNSSIQMAHLAEINHIEYFEFLQPNQYLVGSKQFTSEELDKYVKKESIYASPVEKLYPRIREAAMRIKESQGIKIFDLTQVFTGELGTIYEDDCCHYTKKGYSILTNYISEYINEN
jgi:hypothetical protein